MINLPKLNIPVLKKFRLKRSFISYDYLFEYIFGETNSLIQIFMENIKMADDSLKTFFKYLSPKKSILIIIWVKKSRIAIGKQNFKPKHFLKKSPEQKTQGEEKESLQGNIPQRTMNNYG